MCFPNIVPNNNPEFLTDLLSSTKRDFTSWFFIIIINTLFEIRKKNYIALQKIYSLIYTN